MGGARSAMVDGAVLAVALALILAAHEANRMPGWSGLEVYVYWGFRIGMTYLIIVGVYAALDQVMSGRVPPLAQAALASGLSFPPFVLAVTTLNLVIGDDTLLQAAPDSLMRGLGGEALALIDNHLTLSALLLAPYVLQTYRLPAMRAPQRPRAPESDPAAEAPPGAQTVRDVHSQDTETPGLLLASQPPVLGALLAAEAQEHYVKLKATDQSGMALYRFGDAVRDLSRYQGMQVHRSHWVSDAAVTAVIGKRGAMRIELTTGEIIPVSRRYELEVEAHYEDRARRDE